MWFKKSVHFEQHYLSKWKIIQPRALQWNLSLFLQLLKTIPEVNSSLCRCIPVFCRAEKLSWPYFSTCKTNFLWLTLAEVRVYSWLLAVLCTHAAWGSSQTSQLLWGKGGRKMSSSGMKISPHINFQVLPTEPFTAGFGCVKEPWSLTGVHGGSGLTVR